MSKYLISTTEVYRVDTEEEAKQLIEEAKQENTNELVQYNCVSKEQKQKGEIVQTWYRVTLKKLFNEEKEPSDIIDVSYNKE